MDFQGQGFVTVEEVQRRHSWTSGRVIDALETLLEVMSSFALRLSLFDLATC